MLVKNLLLTAAYRLRGINIREKLEKKQEKVICLTFDDGPSQHTEKLLDLLKEQDVKATFFMVAAFARANPEIVQRIKGSGHTLGLHSFEHKCPLFNNEEYSKHAFDKSISILRELDIEPKYFRPAWGTFNPEIVAKCKEYKLKPVLWNVMAEDWSGNTTSDIILKKLMRRVKPYKVVCLHDGRGENNAPERTIEALAGAISMWKRRGYRFLTMEDVYE